MRKNNIHLTIIAALCITAFTLSGCGRISIPAPEAPLKPLAEPVVEPSVIVLPITVSLSSAVPGLDRLLPKDNGRSSPGNERNLVGKLQGFLQRRAAKINKNELSRNVYVKRAAGYVWDALQVPIKLNKDLSLLINPEDISVSPLAAEGDTMRVVVGFTARPKLVSGPAAPAAAHELPEISSKPALTDQGFHVALESELSFDYASAELTNRLKGTVYPVQGNRIVIEKVRLYGSGGSLVMAVRVDGSVQGDVYLTGVPAYDTPTRTITVKNVAYTVETKQVLVKAADWLLHSKLQQALSEKTSWYVGDRIDAAKEQLARALNRPLNQYVRCEGTIRDLKPVSVGMTASSLKAVFVVEGTVGMTVF